MKTVGIIPNAEKDIGLEKAKEIAAWLCERGIKAVIGWQENIYRDSDFLVILGGDGTLLRASGKAALFNTPLMGINLGTLGYLADVERLEAYTALENVLKGNYKLERRMMLEAQVLSEDGIHIGLNDLCLTRSTSFKMIYIELKINDEYIDTYRADGLIVSTPTGSTAYSLSAGGPILKPDSEMIAVTPVCPHMIYARPIVVSANDIIELRLTEQSTGNALAAIDGQVVHTGKANDIIRIRRSEYYTTIIKTNNMSFFDILRCKMGAGK